MTREEFIEIASGYIGATTEDYNRVKIINKNRLITYYQNGEVCEDKVVQCEIAFDKRDQSLDGKEATYMLLGGFSFPPPIDKEQLRRALEKFGFQVKQKQEATQLSLFDLITCK